MSFRSSVAGPIRNRTTFVEFSVTSRMSRNRLRWPAACNLLPARQLCAVTTAERTPIAEARFQNVDHHCHLSGRRLAHLWMPAGHSRHDCRSANSGSDSGVVDQAGRVIATSSGGSEESASPPIQPGATRSSKSSEVATAAGIRSSVPATRNASGPSSFPLRPRRKLSPRVSSGVSATTSRPRTISLSGTPRRRLRPIPSSRRGFERKIPISPASRAIRSGRITRILSSARSS